MSAPLPTVAPNAPLPLDAEAATRQRYAEAARVREAALCCPVDYDPRFLAAIPKEVIERDYGCGDPSRHVRPGDTVLDLGSGGGKICFIASQITGPTGRVIGVDMNDAMLALARSAAPEVAARIGHAPSIHGMYRVLVERLGGGIRQVVHTRDPEPAVADGHGRAVILAEIGRCGGLEPARRGLADADLSDDGQIRLGDALRQREVGREIRRTARRGDRLHEPVRSGAAIRERERLRIGLLASLLALGRQIEDLAARAADHLSIRVVVERPLAVGERVHAPERDGIEDGLTIRGDTRSRFERVEAGGDGAQHVPAGSDRGLEGAGLVRRGVADRLLHLRRGVEDRHHRAGDGNAVLVADDAAQNPARRRLRGDTVPGHEK